jgi:CheY-like chemotaxis protein
VPKTLLAVDDSATMRKVLEITFSGDDFRVVTADGAQNALARMSEEPRVVVIDTVLGSDDGYSLCKEVRRRDPGAAIVLLSSRHNPYDAAKGRDAGADDFMDKPFDTQQMIDKVRKVLLAREGGAGAPQPGASQPGAGAPFRQPPAAAPSAPEPRMHAPAAPAFTPQPPAAAATASAKNPRGHTLMFGDAPAPSPAPPQARVAGEATMPSRGGPATAPTPATSGRPAPSAAYPHPAPARPPAAQPQQAPSAGARAATTAAASVNGQLAGKLGELGLSPAQIDAVLALSHEVVERVVWEVVPQLAEALIKEEIARLMKDG